MMKIIFKYSSICWAEVKLLFQLTLTFRTVFWEGINLPISRNLGNLKKTHVGNYWRVHILEGPYIGGSSQLKLGSISWVRIPMYGPSSIVWLPPCIRGGSIHQKKVHTSELRCLNMHSELWEGFYAPQFSQNLKKHERQIVL